MTKKDLLNLAPGTYILTDKDNIYNYVLNVSEQDTLGTRSHRLSVISTDFNTIYIHEKPIINEITLTTRIELSVAVHVGALWVLSDEYNAIQLLNELTIIP